MQNSNYLDNVFYPYDFSFKIGTIHNDFIAKDATGVTKAFVKQKLFKFKEHVEVFSDETRSELLFDIRANKWLDFNTTYSFTNASGENVGRLARKGWRSIWKASYELYDERDQQDLVINEKNAWVKVMDAVLSEIPVLGIFTGYFFNPSYTVKRPDGTLVATFTKQASFFGRKFKLTQDATFEAGEEQRIQLGLMMMALLERRRG
ncbi:MAG: hypothetical protein ACOYLO_02715 [Ferruginibacter sp.]